MGLRTPVLVIAAAILVAGCIDGVPGDNGNVRRTASKDVNDPNRLPIPAGWSEAVLQPADDEHDHAVAAHHEGLTTPNYEILGYNPLVTDYYGYTPGGHYCGEASQRDDGRRLSVVHSWTTDVAFIITDVTDPADPQKIGELAMPYTHVYDLTITPDQRYVFLATSPAGVTDELPVQPPLQATFRDACTGDERPVRGPEAGLPYAPGIVLVDVQNPRDPAIVDFLFFPVFGGHSVQVQEIDGQLLIMTTVTNSPGEASYYEFLELQEIGGRPKLVPLSTWHFAQGDAEAFAGRENELYNHDGYFQKHPVTGELLAYLAYGTNGLVILNIDDVRNPVFVSHWNEWDEVTGPDPSHFFHEALPIEGTWDGRHYTFAGEECLGRPPKTPTCLVYAFDTTDPANMELVGAWTLPHDVQWGVALEYSFHYLGLFERTLFVTNYHGGLWAIDVSSLEAIQNMKTIGVFMPTNVSPKPPEVFYPDAPEVDDLNVFQDGTMVVYDAVSGIYTVRFDPMYPAPAPEPWPVMRGG